MSKDKTKQKLSCKFAMIIILIIGLCITTYALTNSLLFIEENTFVTGTISVNLNDGKPIIEEDEFLFEPGMTVTKDFFFENNGTSDVYYKFYFDNIEGELAEEIEITLSCDNKVLYKGKANLFTKDNVSAANEILKINQRKDMTITFHYPKLSDNKGKARSFTFDLKADVVQTKNNPNRLFD